MKRMLYVFTLGLLVLNSNASEQTSQFPLLDLPNFVIQLEIMPKLENQYLRAFANSSKNMHELAQQELEKRYEKNMLMQRDGFKRNLSPDHSAFKLNSVEPIFLYKGVFGAPEFRNLKELYLHNDQLTSLDKDIFKALQNLSFLNLSYNRLASLDKDLFKELENLKTLRLAFNQLNDLNKDIFNSLKNLHELDLSDNQLTILDKDLFKTLKNLKKLNLSCNQLTNLDPAIFNELKCLESLYLYNNQLSPENIMKIKEALSWCNIY